MSAPGGASRLDRPAAALVLVAIAWLSTVGAIGLLEPTETRYAEIAREMRASGDYLVPRLNGIPHYHKPPLAYWAPAAGLAVLGDDSWGRQVGRILQGAQDAPSVGAERAVGATPDGEDRHVRTGNLPQQLGKALYKPGTVRDEYESRHAV